MKLMQEKVIPFVKMHGLGNDFVIIDARRDASMRQLSTQQIRAMSDRHLGIGCDQLIVLEPPELGDQALFFMRIYNQDGSESGACGNATRCIGKLIFEESFLTDIAVRTNGGLLQIARDQGELIAVNLGAARTDWRDIPLSKPLDTLHIAMNYGELSDGVATNVGNPHVTFFVPSLERFDDAAMQQLGRKIETDPLFPERVNVGIATMIDHQTMRLRVWERGAGLTRACGTGATAAWVAAVRRGLTQREISTELTRRGRIILDGGELTIDWRNESELWMIGTASHSFSGSFPLPAA